MTRLVLSSWVLLLYFDCVMRFRSFLRLQEQVDTCAIKRQRRSRLDCAMLCRAVDIACVLYFKQVLCLQRSAATTVLLRSYGWHASMKIGATIVPVTFHAWTEVDDVVVNDKPYVRTLYQILQDASEGA